MLGLPAAALRLNWLRTGAEGGAARVGGSPSAVLKALRAFAYWFWSNAASPSLTTTAARLCATPPLEPPASHRVDANRRTLGLPAATRVATRVRTVHIPCIRVWLGLLCAPGPTCNLRRAIQFSDRVVVGEVARVGTHVSAQSSIQRRE